MYRTTILEPEVVHVQRILLHYEGIVIMSVTWYL